MRSTKGSRKIIVQKTEYRWRATGNDGFISIGIWPTNNIGPFIYSNLGYHSSSERYPGNQIIITNRLIRRIIEHAITEYHYDPVVKGTQLNLRAIDDFI